MKIFNTFSSFWDAGTENNNQGVEGVHGVNDNALYVTLMITKCKAKNWENNLKQELQFIVYKRSMQPHARFRDNFMISLAT